MYHSRLIIIVLLFSFFYSFSQETNQKEVLVKKIEGVMVTYSSVNEDSDYVFNINNESGNAVQLTWDVKIFYSEIDSKEIHKTVKVDPHSKKRVYSLDSPKAQKTLNLEPSTLKKIIRIEVHNFDFKGLRQ